MAGSKAPNSAAIPACERVRFSVNHLAGISAMPDLANIEHLEADLWDAADNLRANSKLTAGEYCMPVLGVIFLRHATNRYNAALREIEADQAAGKMPKRAAIAADFKKRRALMLPKEARYDTLLALPKGADLGTALVKPMEAIERDFAPLKEQLHQRTYRWGEREWRQLWEDKRSRSNSL
jgi:type I restriction-modification system DNA methylase subunit